MKKFKLIEIILVSTIAISDNIFIIIERERHDLQISFSVQNNNYCVLTSSEVILELGFRKTG